MQQGVLTDYQRGQVESRLWDSRDEGIRELLYALSYNPRRVIELRYGLADGHRYTVEEAADVFAKSVNWVISMESCALFQLYQFASPAA